uniref:RRM domain-containing protein n=1 Tax=Peronospora matthiolae TaxID=2874970 RepID=A0AAV1UH18_9STRA
MDLYADLPLAKGAKAPSALDADGQPKTSLSLTSSVWASAPLMVPQAAKNKSSNRSTAAVIASSTLMVPSALTASRGKRSTVPTVSLAFKPAPVARKASAGIPVVCKKENDDMRRTATGTGLGYVAATEVKVTSVDRPQNTMEMQDGDAGSVEIAGSHFFQQTYRDEYQPARPNSYEMYCKERQEKKKLEQVKRELSRRQREQDRESKLEREKLAKDLAAGRAPAMKLLAPAGRGRGMTMPAWMRKKIEDHAASQPESERDVDREQFEGAEAAKSYTAGQFEDAAESRDGWTFPAKGSGFSSSSGSASSAAVGGLFRANMAEPTSRASKSGSRGGSRDNRDRRSSERCESHAPELDEFGREVRHDTKRKRADESVGNYREHNTSSRIRDSHEKGQHRDSGSRSSCEKRHRTSRSPQKTLLRSQVVLLKNMVGPGEVDDELQDEVKGECSEKYGPVTKCVVYEETGTVVPKEAVRIFVQFTNVEDATKALTGLHGRFFGGRRVKAAYYDESKFDRMDLTS